MARTFNVVIERDEDGLFVASIPELPGCHTQGASLDQVMERIREAAEACLAEHLGLERQLEFVGIQRITIVA